MSYKNLQLSRGGREGGREGGRKRGVGEHSYLACRSIPEVNLKRHCDNEIEALNRNISLSNFLSSRNFALGIHGYVFSSKRGEMDSGVGLGGATT